MEVKSLNARWSRHLLSSYRQALIVAVVLTVEKSMLLETLLFEPASERFNKCIVCSLLGLGEGPDGWPTDSGFVRQTLI